jgi:hypothetical protein
MSDKPNLPSAQSPATMPTGALSPEWYRFLLALLTYADGLERRITALENAS